VNTYYLTSKVKILYTLIPILVLILVFETSIFNYIYFGMFAIFILFITFKGITSEHIVLSDTRIEYHRVGLTFNVNWENIEEINMHWSIPLSIPLKQEGLYIDQSLIKITEWWSGSYLSYGGYGGWGRKSFIPLSIFSENWRDSELGQQIKEYAPHLFK
jgi:hypothetical protein